MYFWAQNVIKIAGIAHYDIPRKKELVSEFVRHLITLQPMSFRVPDWLIPIDHPPTCVTSFPSVGKGAVAYSLLAPGAISAASASAL